MDTNILLIDNLLQKLRSSIPVFIGDSAIWLANEINKWLLKRADLVNRYSTHANYTNNMSNIRFDSGLIANTQVIKNRAFWASGQPIGAPLRNFRQMQYLFLHTAFPNLDQALNGSWVDSALDLHNQLIEFGGAAKVWITVQVQYEPTKPESDKRQAFDQYLSATPTRIFKREGSITTAPNLYTDSFRILTDRIKEFNAKFIKDKSGLRLSGILQLILKMAKYQPLQGSGWQPLPDYLEKKKAIVNIKNEDERCFGYALLFFLDRPRYSHNLRRPYYYTPAIFKRNGLDALPYPISPNDVHLYEDKLNVNINVFSFFDDEGRARHPMVVSRKTFPRVANLLYWKGHYAPINSISRLFFDITKHKEPKNICLRCLGHFKTPEILSRHQLLCTRDDYMSVLHVLPVPGSERSQIKFNQFRNTTKAPFVIYADFESILEPFGTNMQRTTYAQHHKVCAAAAILCSNLLEFNQRTMIKVGAHALSDFLDELSKWETEIISVLKRNVLMKQLTARQQEDYKTATRCYICQQLFQNNEIKGPKVRDHDHITGFFLGAAHRQCNLERPVNFQIPIFFHNFRGYDAHLIVHEFGKRPGREVKVIGQNMEKYLQVQWGDNMVFRDSLQFLPASLEQLVASLFKTGREHFINLHKVVSNVCPNCDVALLERKGVFCYDHIDSFERLEEPTLPNRDAFYNKLSGEECSQADYAHAQHVWTEFKCNTLKDYMILYLLSDICSLADVFETFRSNSLDEYQLDPAYYMSAPQLAWNALLKFINRPIHLITDPEMYRMIQPNIRGGICHVSVRYARANNKLMGSLYDPTKPTSFIMEVDANNLYGWAMSQAMPDGDFEWLSESECREMEHRLINEVDREIFSKNRSYILEVDLEYPEELHERDEDYPMAPELMTIEAKMTGQKQHELRTQYFGAACPFTRKLVCSFLPKNHYVVLGQLLVFYIDRGMRLLRVHRAIRFPSSPYVAGYIANNTAKRQQYKHDDVKKSFYKLMNNAPYGKTIENAARRSDIRLLNDMEKARKLAEKPHCVDFRVFDGNVNRQLNEKDEQNEALIGIEMRKLNHFSNKSFANGFCVLEWSKLKMYSYIIFIILK